VSAELALAEHALAFCDGDAQVTVTRERSLHTRFARSAPTQATDVEDLTVHVMALRDGQAGGATTNAADDDALRSTARRAAEAAAAAAAHGAGDHPGLPGPQAYRAHEGFDLATARLDPATAGEQLRAAFAAADEEGLQAFGIWSAGEVRTAIASSAGVRASDAVTDVFGKVVCRTEDGRSGYASGAAVAARDVDLGALARRAAAHVARGPLAELGPGTYPVVLGADAVGELLGQLGGLAFNGLAHAEGRGALAGRLGARVAAAAINLSDSPRFRGTLPRAFDADGVPKAPVPLIQDGVAHRVVHDLRSAARAGGGAASTGHAVLPGGSPWGPAPTNLVLVGGGAEDEGELARPIERGLYVHRLWYVNAVDPKETLLTGVTRDGTHLIEDGEITRPLRDVRFTDTALGLLDRTQALGSRPRLVCDAEFYGRRFATGVVCPPLRAAGLRITGGA
jgi:predicted Zn-dependent protease